MRCRERRSLGENNGEVGGDNGERRQEGKLRLRKGPGKGVSQIGGRRTGRKSRK
jgi:hypothetical protein